MIARSTQSGLQRTFRFILKLCFLGILAWFFAAVVGRWHVSVRGMDDTRAQVLLTLVGLTIGAWFCDILAAGIRPFPRRAVIGIFAVILSQVFYLLLVWTDLKTRTIPWRLWWIAIIPAVTFTHTMTLRLWAGQGSLFERITRACAIVAAVMWGLLGLQKSLPPEPSPMYLWILGILAAITILGSFVAWLRWKRRYPAQSMSRAAKVGWLITAQAALCMISFYLGRVTTPPPGSFAAMPSALAHLSDAELRAQITADLQRLRIVSNGLDELREKAWTLHQELRARQANENRDYFLPAEEDQIRAQFMTYLAYRAALLRLVATYAAFESVMDPDLRASCFLVGYAAGSTAYGASATLVATYREDNAARKKLNEPDPVCGIPAGMFDRIYESVINDANVETLEEMAAYFEAKRAHWHSSKVLPADFDWLQKRIDSAVADARTHQLDRDAAWMEQLMLRVKNDAYSPVYAVQSLVSSWIGDTRLVQRQPFITHDQIVEMQAQLRPGDILLERRNWFLSNAFLPGFWPHAAIYVGTVDDLERLGIVRKEDGEWRSDDMAVRERLEEYLKPAHDGSPHTVLESVSEGVIFNSLTESMHADYVAVLRPRLTDEQKAEAIKRAFLHKGRPYDFEFDFATADKLVCTELVYRSYEGLLHFDLVKIMGRDTLPALEICKKFSRERTKADRQLDFVMFLDAGAGESKAKLATEEVFCASADRPKGFNE